ncbi:MAG: hypothetical protein ACRCY8_00880 [Dermatophilaceae bacterium]
MHALVGAVLAVHVAVVHVVDVVRVEDGLVPAARAVGVGVGLGGGVLDSGHDGCISSGVVV